MVEVAARQGVEREQQRAYIETMQSSRVATFVATLTEEEKQALLIELQSHDQSSAAQSGRGATLPVPADIDLLWLLDQLPSMVAYWDLNQRCRYANRSYQEWFGRSQAQMLQPTLPELPGPLYRLNLPSSTVRCAASRSALSAASRSTRRTESTRAGSLHPGHQGRGSPGASSR